MELSADQIRQQLQALLNPGTGEQPDGTWISAPNWIRDTYATYCVYQNDVDGKLYRQDFAVDGANVTLSGSAAEVIVAYATPGEMPATTEGEGTPPEQPAPTLSRHILTGLLRGGARVLNANLQAAMVEAATAGDAETTAAIAGILKKQQAATEDPAAVATGGAAPAKPGEQSVKPDVKPAETVQLDEPNPAEAQVREAAQTVLAAKYPGATVEITAVQLGAATEGAEGDVTFTVTDAPAEDGAEPVVTKYTVHVTIGADGAPDVGEPEEVTEAPPEQVPPADGAVVMGAKPSSSRRYFTPLKPTLLSDTSDATWVNVINLGTYEHEEYGTVTFSEDDFKSWKKNLSAGVFGGIGPDGKPRIAADYGHAMDDPNADPSTQKAAGYITDLKLEGERVYAKVEFTKNAAEAVRNGEFSWWSVSVHPGVMDTGGENTGPVMLGGALTNRPFIPGLEAIQLSDLRPAKAVQLQQQLAARDAEIITLRRQNFDAALKVTLDVLRRAGVPPVVINLARPVLERDFDHERTVKLSRAGKVIEHKPGELLVLALLEFAKTGKVATQEVITLQQDHSTVTLDAAIEEIKRDKPSIRHKDAILAARSKYPHLKG